MDNESEIKVAINYREQLQEKNHKPIKIDSSLLKKMNEHLHIVFPDVDEDDPFSLKALHKFLEEKDPNFNLNATEILRLLEKDKIDVSDPVYKWLSSGKTKFDDFITGAFSETYEKSLTKACNELKLNIRGGISVGIIDEVGLQAHQIPVWMTETSVINITTELTIVTNRISKLMAKSMAFNIAKNSTYQLSENLSDYKLKILSDPQLQYEWDMFFADCAYNPKRPPKGDVVSMTNEYDQSCFVDFSDAITTFILGHECGHHVADHSLGGTASVLIDDDMKGEHENELVADMIGSHITMHLGHDKEEANWFSASNVGAICILKVIDLINKSHLTLKEGDIEQVDYQVNGGHPPLDKRLKIIQGFVEYFYSSTETAGVVLKMQNLILELLDFIWQNSSKHIEKMYINGTRPENDDKQWLP